MLKRLQSDTANKMAYPLTGIAAKGLIDLRRIDLSDFSGSLSFGLSGGRSLKLWSLYTATTLDEHTSMLGEHPEKSLKFL